MQFLHLWLTSLLDGLDFIWLVSFRIKKKIFFKKNVSQRLFWSYSFLWNFLAVVLGLRPSRLNEASQDLQPTPILGPWRVCSHPLMRWLQFRKTQGPAHLFLLPLTCDQFNSVFQWKKEVFCILQGCNILLGYIFLQIFLASQTLKGFSLSFAFLCAYDFFISISSLFCSLKLL